jgi:hypothetical protein
MMARSKKKQQKTKIPSQFLQWFFFPLLGYSLSYINVSFGPSRTVELQTKGLKGSILTKGKGKEKLMSGTSRTIK